MAQNDGIYTCLCAFPAQNPVNCDGFGLRTLQSGHTVNASVFMFSAPPIFKSGLKPRYLQVFLWRKGLLRCLEASKWHKATVLTRASAPSCHKTLYIGMVSSYVRFKVATKHRKYH